MRAENCFIAWNEAEGATQVITRQEMVDSLMGAGARLGRGTPACAVLERQAAEIARGGTAGYTTVAMAREMGGVW